MALKHLLTVNSAVIVLGTLHLLVVKRRLLDSKFRTNVDWWLSAITTQRRKTCHTVLALKPILIPDAVAFKTNVFAAVAFTLKCVSTRVWVNVFTTPVTVKKQFKNIRAHRNVQETASNLAVEFLLGWWSFLPYSSFYFLRLRLYARLVHSEWLQALNAMETTSCYWHGV